MKIKITIFLIYCSGLIHLTWGRNKACSLEIVIDPYFYQNHQSKSPLSTHLEIKRQLRSLVNEYVDFTNEIMKKYSFSQDGSQLQFYIKRIKILNFDKGCDTVDEHYCSFSSNIHELLVGHSKINHNDVCLSYVFTYQHLADSTLGLAWSGNSKIVDEGGVCAKFHEVQQTNETKKKEWRSHNTGVVNFAYNNNELPSQVVKLAFMHEIGHSLGSPHDYPTKCNGDAIQGNYLMHKSGVRGYLQNNYGFSGCSYRNITFFINSMRKQDRYCFENVPREYCGNGIVERSEECDCGESTKDCEEQCCFPADHSDRPCQLKPRSWIVCSPSEGPCCTDQCAFTNEIKCSQETQCQFGVTCDGSSSNCPIALFKADTSPCDGGSKICTDGKCEKSVCAKFNQVECSINGSNPCEVHCQVPNRPNTCQSSTKLNSFFPQPIHRAPGALCDMPIQGDATDGYTLGVCSEGNQCFISGQVLSSGNWAVGLGIFLVFYAIFMALGIWLYCKYCRAGAQTKQQLVLKANSSSD